jgi:hypothetical protein
VNTRQVAAEYRLAQWTQALAERKANGESISDFCRNKGVSRNTYFYWQRKLREAACERLSEIQSPSTGLSVQGFTEVQLAHPPVLPIAVSASQICVEAGRYKITTDSAYPTDSLVALLRKLPC